MKIFDPPTLMNWISSISDRHESCLECGSGNAEISRFMSNRYSRVFSLDINHKHLKLLKLPVQGICGTANEIPFENNSIDMLISMQALHHFIVEKHLGEAHRVLGNGGIFAALCWGGIELPAKITSAYSAVMNALDPYWEEIRPWLLDGYNGLEFNGTAVPLPPTRMIRIIDFNELDQMIASWSSTKTARLTGIEIPTPKITKQQRQEWQRFPVSWPLLGKVFRV